MAFRHHEAEEAELQSADAQPRTQRFLGAKQFIFQLQPQRHYGLLSPNERSHRLARLCRWRCCLFAKVQHPQAVAEIEKQVGRLVHKRFLADLPCERLNHLPRYLKTAQELRIPMPVSVKRLQKRWEGMGR
ncbi:MAG TPA: DUF3418 domain-containing protein [Accumulibacter sp.]|uniref:DUF3418 domain-containing protein n=2 Tax=Candidatus Accumulibacter TaxID=327159 RepID=A0A7D5SCR6_9PROT|nr:DUF3418 domain-containing protein [Accumulibacter sp.]KFB73061.1 MAG: hypothetical protein AW09_001700 [Candidatus Accumulibacter phosphatis]QLH49399.1 MAG: DUF3418 domain-containing protein [Candidatus Accumulibacter cognatus]MBL8402568.1 DUF3418 domain-containing protein [Accumulibacter sp.]MCC2866678.1 DUF3418 domain-containing protein [Candidatus Accumulibacter phosphatis]MCM8578617.1 DUF3418 domain-containing protein [Accumulibacter sp.]